VEELHFGRAADRVHISQPPLSQAIRRLEDELGVKLLERTSRTVSPTAAGLVFAEEARKVLANFEFAVAEARRAGGASTTLRVGCIPHLPAAKVHRFLDEVREHLPGSNPQVTHLLALEQAGRLVCGELDIGIFVDAGEHPGVEKELLLPGDAMVAYLPREHPLAAKESVGPEDLADLDRVLFPRSANPPLHDELLELASDAGYRFRAVREAGGASPRDMVMAVACGLGVSLEPMAEVGEVEALVVRRPLEPPVWMPDTAIAWRADPPRHVQPLVATIRSIARAVYAGSAGERARTAR
jgi:DNA-binding transcriptional LysR family regulator